MSVSVPIGYKKTRIGVMPEDWAVIALKDIVSDFLVPMRDKPKVLTGDIPWCRIEDFDGKYLTSSKSKQGVTAEVVENMNLKVYPCDTVLVSCSADLGRCAIVKKELVTNQTFIGLVTIKELLDEEYLYYTMINSSHKLNALSSGTTIAYLSRKEFENFKIPFPELNEQKKIAKILNTLDNVITKQEALIQAKEVLKKGFMKKLLSGDIRFDGFDDEWKEVKLGDIASFYKGKGISKNDITEDGTECIRYGELYTKYNERIVDIISRTSVRKEELFLSQENDVLIPASGETAIDLATASCVLKEGIGLGGDINIIRTNNDGTFLSYYLNVIAKTKIASYAQGVSVIHLYAAQLKNLQIKLPTFQEQQKISKFLIQVDKEIYLLKNELKVLKEQKRGLMQKILTGEVRVNI